MYDPKRDKVNKVVENYYGMHPVVYLLDNSYKRSVYTMIFSQ
jgi:hypothetical protein